MPIETFAARLPTQDGQLHVLHPAGIGDFLWTWGKWRHVNRDVTFWFPQGEQKRAGALAQMLGARYGYMPGLTTRWVWDQPGEPPIPDTGGVIAVHPNAHLESGLRIEKWYPDLPFENPVNGLQVNTALYKTEVGSPRYVVAFMCTQAYMEAGGNLHPAAWGRILALVEQRVAPVVIVGAGRDVEYAERVCDTFDPTFSPVFNASLDQVAELLRGAVATVGCASGITILSTYLGVPTFHAYPRHLARMPGTWEQPSARAGWCFLDDLENHIRAGALEALTAARAGGETHDGGV